MNGDYDKSFEIVVGEEAGYVNDPADPGGETKYGICKRDFPDENIAALTLARAKVLYRPYWDAVKGDALPWPLCLYAFDSAINQGATAAVKMLQRALDVPQDGLLGPATMGKAANAGEWHAARFMAFRAMRYQSTKNFDRFGVGWLTRCFTIMAKGAAR